MVFVLGLCCVAWTIFELVRLAERTPSLAQPGGPARSRRPASGPRRVPLAAWDDQGRPVFVEDVTLRGMR